MSVVQPLNDNVVPEAPPATGLPHFFRRYQYFWKYVKPYTGRFLLALFITVPIGLMDGLIPFSIKLFLDDLSQPTPSIKLHLIPFMVIGFSMLQGTLNYLSTYLNGNVGERITMDIRMNAYQKLLNSRVEKLMLLNSGFIIGRFFNDPSKVKQFLLQNTRTIINRITSILSISCVMCFLNWKLCLIALGTLSFILIPLNYANRRITQSAREEQQSANGTLALLNSTHAGIKVIYGFNLQRMMSKQYWQRQRDAFDKMMRITKAQAMLSPFMYLITSVGISIILWYSGQMILAKEMTPGDLIAFTTSLLMLYRPIQVIGTTAINIQRTLTAVDRYMALEEDHSMDITNILNKDPTAKLIKTRQFYDKIEMKDFSFYYRRSPELKVLKNINLTIHKGDMIAIVGRSGAGKTTLIEMLLGFYPVKPGMGHITFDGHPYHYLDLTSLRQHFAFVGQDNFLFDGSLKDNVLLGKPEASDAEIEAALRRAHLWDFVQTLPQGWDTPVGERGTMLSGGQRQRVAIARAFLKNAEILILDEATSALDNETEALIQQALDDLMANRTVIVIAHRFSTIQKAQKIVVLDDGRIVEQGSHEELMVLGGLYYHLFMSQFQPGTVEAWGLAPNSSTVELQPA